MKQPWTDVPRGSHGLARWGGLVLAAAVGLLSCRDATGPQVQPPYLAVVARIDAQPGVDVGGPYYYFIRELSGTIPIDTVIQAAPGDTVIIPVRPATYTVTLQGLPPKCTPREGLERTILVPEDANTSLVRYVITCLPLVTIDVVTEGRNADDGYLYSLTGDAGFQRTGLLSATDTVLLEKVPPGSYRLELADVSPNCVVTSAGLARPRLEVPNEGGASLSLRVQCGDAAARPEITYLAATYREGAHGLVLSYRDPDRDALTYVWDLTDCDGRSISPFGPRTRNSLRSGRVGLADSATVFTVFETGLPDAVLASSCAAVRLVDEFGNPSPWVERRLKPVVPSAAPLATSFDAEMVDFVAVRVRTLNVFDRERDFLGTHPILRLRDGSLGQADGIPETVLFTVNGLLGAEVPELRLEVPGQYVIQYYNVLRMDVFLIDRNGNFSQVTDDVL